MSNRAQARLVIEGFGFMFAVFMACFGIPLLGITGVMSYLLYSLYGMILFFSVGIGLSICGDPKTYEKPFWFERYFK